MYNTCNNEHAKMFLQQLSSDTLLNVLHDGTLKGDKKHSTYSLLNAQKSLMQLFKYHCHGMNC